MTRLIDADDLCWAIESDHRNTRDFVHGDRLYQKDVLDIITAAPTVQREVDPNIQNCLSLAAMSSIIGFM